MIYPNHHTELTIIFKVFKRSRRGGRCIFLLSNIQRGKSEDTRTRNLLVKKLYIGSPAVYYGLGLLTSSHISVSHPSEGAVRHVTLAFMSELTLANVSLQNHISYIGLCSLIYHKQKRN